MRNWKTTVSEQCDLFEDRPKIESLKEITRAVDRINETFGKHTVSLATSLYLSSKPQNARDAAPPRRNEFTLRGETGRQRLAIPRLSIKV